MKPSSEAQAEVDALPRRGHGSLYSYRYDKCRCDDCRAANSMYHRLLMARYSEEGGRGKHGTAYRYDTGCRCDDCRRAHNSKSRETKRRRRVMGTGGAD